MEKLRSLTNKKQFRFIVVGASATVIDFAILNLLNLLGVPSIVANTISTGLSMLFSFFANKKFTFKSESKNYVRQVVLFIIFTLFGLWVIQNLIIQGLLSILPTDWPELIRLNGAKIIATFASMIWNYTTYARFVFTETKSNSKPTTSE
jgi:putative flippase GtrA